MTRATSTITIANMPLVISVADGLSAFDQLLHPPADGASPRVFLSTRGGNIGELRALRATVAYDNTSTQRVTMVRTIPVQTRWISFGGQPVPPGGFFDLLVSQALTHVESDTRSAFAQGAAYAAIEASANSDTPLGYSFEVQFCQDNKRLDFFVVPQTGVDKEDAVTPRFPWLPFSSQTLAREAAARRKVNDNDDEDEEEDDEPPPRKVRKIKPSIRDDDDD